MKQCRASVASAIRQKTQKLNKKREYMNHFQISFKKC